MRNDATEAALGLLGLGSLSTIPLKRKQSASSTDPLDSSNSDSISCICGFTDDDGFSIGCDSCSRWCHAACFGIVEDDVPEEWQCWQCSPRSVDKERAVRLQKARRRAAAHNQESERHRRRSSPGVDRKGRRVSAVPGDGGGGAHKRKRRPSVVVHHSGEDEHVDIDEPWTHSYVPITKDIVPHDETRDKLRRVATEWRGITAIDAESNASTSSCGGTPVILDSIPSGSQINLRPLSKSSYHPSLSLSVDPSILPPSYAAHASRSIPSSSLVTPFTSTIIPTSAYLSDPLNAYAHLSMPKPFVHLVGPPLDVALDARTAGNQARFVRNGCRPNAVLRPVLCPQKAPSDSEEETLTFGIFALRDLKAHEEVVLGWEWDDGSVIHHLPALIDSPHIFPPHRLQHFRQQLTSMLHALSSTFTTCACGSRARDCAITRMAEFVDSQTPPTPSPSPPSMSVAERDRQDEVDESDQEARFRRKTNLGPLVGAERGFRTRERVPSSGGLTGVEVVPSSSESYFTTPTFGDPLDHHGSSHPAATNPAPNIRSSKGRNSDRKGKARATDETPDDHVSSTYHSLPRRSQSPEGVSEDAESEVKLPPKLRKGWIRKSLDSLRVNHDDSEQTSDETATGTTQPIVTVEHEASADDVKMDVDHEVFDPKQMPPPPLPPPRNPQLSLPTPILPPPARISPSVDARASPSSSFAKLSLFSPSTPDLVPRFANARTPSPSSSRHHRPSPAPVPQDASSEQDILSFGGASPLDTSPASPHLSTPGHDSLPLPDARPPSPTPPPATPSPPRTSPRGSPQPVAEDAMHVDPAVHAQDVNPFGGTDPLPTEGSTPGSHAAPPQQDTGAAGDSVVTTQVQSSTVQPSSPAPPPPPPKVKLSLKDFARRKRQQREEHPEQHVPPTPVVQTVPSSTNVSESTDAVDPASANPTRAQMTQCDVFNDVRRELKTTEAVLSTSTPVICSTEMNTARDHVADKPPASDSLQAKIEMMEDSVPCGLVVVDDRAPRRSPSTAEFVKEDKTDRIVSPRFCTPDENLGREEQARQLGKSKTRPLSRSQSPDSAMSRQNSQEDGEILSPPPPAKTVPYAPRSHSPPTHPRSFHQGGLSPSRHAPPARRPLYPAAPRALQNSSRPLPSGPRALRELNYTPYSPPVSRGPPGVPSIPRGPSADRDRGDWDRDRLWTGRGRGRGGWIR
ncbi:hypothetical protein WOLCODRAFT_154334 [Wolfiporia cocos MD-104 SS10]|uniref:PHD-type domain-containing protein n=1 Tax=Wolfiporia cocos (strain MD-104) TaxID=742152 RepID=A0A2H3JQ62_WOLCO|nr:hypothetical protein WOLCODRAFT_154334 [Wolfiporia cocos MD-104 SS10]